MKTLYKPNFQHSNINISATLAEFLHAKNSNAILPQLKEKLEKGYEKVVFICFDGMGIYPMQRNLDKADFLWQHVADTLLAPFPSTTTNATTSLLTNKLPLEHGWFGWSVYFKQMHRNINIFLDEDSWTGEKVEITESPLKRFPYYFDCAQTDYEINTLFPAYVKANHPERNTVFSGVDDFFCRLKQLCAKRGKQFIYAYCPEPDHTMHEVGVTCEITKQLFRRISDGFSDVVKSCKNTLFIATADHGQIDVGGYVELYKDQKLLDMLKIYPYLEPRAVAFLVKDGMKENFRQYFEKTYGADFYLYKSADLIEQGYFGDVGDRAELLGDFIAVSCTDRIAAITPSQPLFLGHHTGLTEEMQVPLILVDAE